MHDKVDISVVRQKLHDAECSLRRYVNGDRLDSFEAKSAICAICDDLKKIIEYMDCPHKRHITENPTAYVHKAVDGIRLLHGNVVNKVAAIKDKLAKFV